MSWCAFSISSRSRTACGVLAYGVGEQAPVVVADVARGRADEPGDGVLLLVLAHVEPEQAHAKGFRKLPRKLRLAHSRRADEQQRGDRLVPLAEARARLADCAHHELYRVVLPEDLRLQPRVQVLQALALPAGDAGGGDPRDPRHHLLDHPRCRPAAAPRLHRFHHRCAPRRRPRPARRWPCPEGGGR